MRNSNFAFRRFFIIFANVFVFIGAFFVLTMIAFYTIAALRNQITELTAYDNDFRTVITDIINKGYFPVVALIIYMGAMQLIYSALIIKWAISLNDEQFIKHRWLILVYSFFNMTFFTGFMLLSLDQKRIETGIKAKRKMALHESSVFALSGAMLIMFTAVLLLTKNLNSEIVNIKQPFVITLSVAGVFLLFGVLGLLSISKLKNVNLPDSNSLQNVPVKSFNDQFAKLMIGFSIIFILVKMLIVLVINTIGYLSQMFSRENRGFFSNIGATINLIFMYTIVYQVFQALLQKDDQPLVIDLSNVDTKRQHQRF